MTTALHLVPDPDDEHTPPSDTAGEQQPTQAAPAAVEAELEDEEPAPMRALAMPDLRPYASLAWIPAVINAGLEANRRWRKQAPERKATRRARKKERRAAGEPPGRRRLWAMGADYLAGTRILLGHLAAWLGGEYGPKDMKTPARLAALGFAGYCAVRTITTWPVWGPVGITVVWCCAALGALHRQRAEQGEKKPTREAAKEEAKPRDQAPVEGAEQTPTEAAAEPPAEDPLTALIRAEIGAENGVHLADLRPAMRAALPTLSQATDEELRERLVRAGWDPSKKFRARGRAGRQGVHRNQLPPLPSPDGGPGPVSAPALRCGDAGQRASAESSGEQAERGGEGSERQFDVLPDPERGPSAWRIVHHGDT
ncbi:hypothetical protein ACIQMV_19245 [Streptomyces sp. NPDC091412]|uniref:hypothetical protein n=1 Tax=Streptomyces sp. NPDC091412 TaxID=3366002 RepID=UPI00382592A5